MGSTIDLALQAAGVGRYQVVHAVLLAAASRCTYLWHLLVIIFSGYYNDHHCTLPNGNFTVDDWIPKITGPDGQPMYAQCSMYNDTSSNITVQCLSGMTYDPEYFDPNGGTIVMEWNLVCEKEGLVEVSIVLINVGVFFGTFFGSSLGDIFGRKKAYFLSALALMVFGVASAFVPEFISFCVLQFIKGVFVGGTFTQGLVLLSEIFPKDILPIIVPFGGVVASLGASIYCGIAYLFRHWRHLQLATSIIPGIFLLYFWWCPESLRWLVSKGRKKEAERILMTISRWNNGTYKEGSLDFLDIELVVCADVVTQDKDANENNNNQYPPHSIIEDTTLSNDLQAPYATHIDGKVTEAASTNDTCNKRNPFMEYMRNSATRRYMFIMCYLDFVINITYYGLMYMMGSLTGNIYLNTALNGLLGIPACLLTILVVKHIGRRYGQSGFFIFQGFFMCLSAAVKYMPSLGDGVLTTIFCLVAKIGEGGATQTKLLYASELAPTNIRSTVIGIQTGCAYIGALIAPFISITLMKVQFWIPGVTYGVLAIVGGGLALLLPETRGRNMPESTQEVASWSLTLSQSEKDSIKTAKCNTGEDNKCFQVENDVHVVTDVNKQLEEYKSYHECNTYM